MSRRGREDYRGICTHQFFVFRTVSSDAALSRVHPPPQIIIKKVCPMAGRLLASFQGYGDQYYTRPVSLVGREGFSQKYFAATAQRTKIDFGGGGEGAVRH